MAPSTPWIATCATAAVSGLLALATGTSSIPSASPLPAGAVDISSHAALHNKASAATKSTTGQLHRSTAGTTHAATVAGGTATRSTRHGATHSAAQRVNLSSGSSSEYLVGRTAGVTSTSHVLTLRQTSLRSAKSHKLSPSPSPSPSPTATTTADPTAVSPSPTATSTATPSPTPTATATATASPTPTATAAPSPTATATPSPTPTATVTASPTPTPTSTLSPSGQSAPVGDLTGWHQTYVEDFGTAVATGGFPGTAYSAHWGVYQDGWLDTSKNGTYMPSKVMSVHDGMMDYYIHSENGVHMVSAPWVTTTKGQAYGRYSVRFRADALPGYKTAWLLWPDSESWPADGEIDFPEGNLGSTDHINAFAHYASSTGGQDAFSTSATYAPWHTATVEWIPGKITFYLDGAVIGTSTKMVPTNPMHWVLQTETNLDGYAPSSTVAGHVYVDWVSTWSKV